MWREYECVPLDAPSATQRVDKPTDHGMASLATAAPSTAPSAIRLEFDAQQQATASAATSAEAAAATTAASAATSAATACAIFSREGRFQAVKRGRTLISSYKGVGWHSQSNKWLVHIIIDGKATYLGLFSDEEAAAREYDNVAAPLGRPLNFPDCSLEERESTAESVALAPPANAAYVAASVAVAAHATAPAPTAAAVSAASPSLPKPGSQGGNVWLTPVLVPHPLPSGYHPLRSPSSGGGVSNGGGADAQWTVRNSNFEKNRLYT
jgi:biotin carboxyl carrier protein